MKLTNSQLQIKQGLTSNLLHDSSEIIKFWIDFGNRFHIRSYIPTANTVKTEDELISLQKSYILKLEEYAKTLPEYNEFKDIY